MGDLKSVFLAFCDSVKKGSTTATDKTLKKICTDCKIYCKGMDANRVDIQFRKHLGNAKKDVDFGSFVQFIEGALSDAYMEAKSISKEDAVKQLKDKISAGSPAGHGVTAASKDDATNRLTDVKNYTGSHKERFDMETGKGKGIAGREDVVDAKAAAGYVGGYKGQGTYDKTHPQ
ncbi:unnamed protein product [Schistocephalus solidus]|uniref:Tubulin polymerization-promoting protein family member 3 n=1 Tax=Schistocephalus solidus TaxID=70667 RepID=A0A0X3PSS5_SCHSO|nr:unnamed protein product [Schistocephalus solidus]